MCTSAAGSTRASEAGPCWSSIARRAIGSLRTATGPAPRGASTGRGRSRRPRAGTRPASSSRATAATRGAVDKTRLFVYRPGQASYYGPGFYGNRTACGQTLTPGTLGVANRWLPCGTRVTFRYHGRTVTVPVIDRGPYHGSRIWDLTYATKRKLGFGSTGVVWSTR